MARSMRWSFGTTSNRTTRHREIRACQLVVMFLAHASQNGLFLAIFYGTKLLFGTMGNATATLNSHFVATLGITSSTSRTMCAAHTSLLHVLGTSRVATGLSFGTMGNTKSSLDDTIWTIGYGALTTNALTGTTSSKSRSIFRTTRRVVARVSRRHALLLVTTTDGWWIAIAFRCHGLRLTQWWWLRRRSKRRRIASIVRGRCMQIAEKHDIRSFQDIQALQEGHS